MACAVPAMPRPNPPRQHYGSDSARMWEWVTTHGSATVDELAAATGVSRNSVHQFLYRKARAGLLEVIPKTWSVIR
jgi:hypothetical protein